MERSPISSSAVLVADTLISITWWTASGAAWPILRRAASNAREDSSICLRSSSRLGDAVNAFGASRLTSR